MKNNSGITMISLVVTVVILMLISTITVNLSTGAYELAKVQGFVAKLKVIQSKVDNIAEESDENTNFGTIYGFVKLNDISDSEDKELFQNIIANPTDYNIDTNNSWNSTLDSKPENYYYFTPQDLQSKLGLADQDMTVIINFKTRNVIAKNSVKEDGKKFYRQYDVEAGGEKIK